MSKSSLNERRIILNRCRIRHFDSFDELPRTRLHCASNFHLEILLVCHTSISLSTHDSFEPDSFIPFNTDSRHIYRQNNFLNYILTPPVIKFFPGNKSEETCSLSRFSRIFPPLSNSFSWNSKDTSTMIERITPPSFLSSSSPSNFFQLFFVNANIFCCRI